MLSSSALPLLTVTLPCEKVESFASLLQHGILYPIDRPVTLGPFLCALPGFSLEYLEQKVQTIFINGAAADSFDAVLAPGSVVALSAAMPGLAGAIFRRQGLHGSLRSQITNTNSTAPTDAPGFIKVKFFNHIAIDRVRGLLRAGAVLEGRALHDFAVRREDIFQIPVGLELDHEKIAYRPMLQQLKEYSMIRLTLQESALAGN